MRLAVRNARVPAARRPWGSDAAAVRAGSSLRRPCWWRSADIERSLIGCDGRAGAGWCGDRFQLRAGAPQMHASGNGASPAWRVSTSDVHGGSWHSRRSCDWFPSKIAGKFTHPLGRTRANNPQHLQQLGRQHDVTVFVPLCVRKNYVAMAAKRQAERTVLPVGGNITFAYEFQSALRNPIAPDRNAKVSSPRHLANRRARVLSLSFPDRPPRKCAWCPRRHAQAKPGWY